MNKKLNIKYKPKGMQLDMQCNQQERDEIRHEGFCLKCTNLFKEENNMACDVTNVCAERGSVA